MADRRLDQSTSLTTLAAGDLFLIGDVSDTLPLTGAPIIKKMTTLNAGQSLMSIIVSAATSVSSLTGSTTFLINDGASKINYSSLVTNLTSDLPFQNEATTAVTSLTSTDTFLVVNKTGLITYSNVVTNLSNDLPFQNEATTAVTSLTSTDTFLVVNKTGLITYSNVVTNLSNDLPFQNEATTAITTITSADTFLVVNKTSLITYGSMVTSLSNDLPFQNEATTSITTITSADTFLVVGKTSLITYGSLVTALTNDLPFSTGSTTAITAVITAITSADTFIINQSAQFSYANLLTSLTNDLPFATSSGTIVASNAFPTAYVNSAFTANDTSTHTYITLESCMANITSGYTVYIAPETVVLSSTTNIAGINFSGAPGVTTIQIDCSADVTFGACSFSGINFQSKDNLTFNSGCSFGGMTFIQIIDYNVSITADLTLTLEGAYANAAVYINQSGASQGFRNVNCSGHYDFLNIQYDYSNSTPYETIVNLTDIYANRAAVSGIVHCKIGGNLFSAHIAHLYGNGTFFEFNNNATIQDSELHANSLCYYGSNINHKGVFSVEGILNLAYTSISSMYVHSIFRQGFINMVARSNNSGTDILFENVNCDLELAFNNSTINTYSSISTIFACLNDNTSALQTITNGISPNHNIRIALKNIEYFTSTNYTNVTTSQLSLLKMNAVDVLQYTSSKTYNFSNSVFNFTYGAYAAATNTAIGMFTNGIKITAGHIQNMRVINSVINLERAGIYGSDDINGIIGSALEGYFENTTINIGNMYVSAAAVSCASRTIFNYNDFDMKNCTLNMGSTYITTTSAMTELVYKFYYVTAAASARIDGCTFNLYGLSTSSKTAQLSWELYGIKNSTINFAKDNHTFGGVIVGGDNNKYHFNDNTSEYLSVYHGTKNSIQDVNVLVMALLNAAASDTIFVNSDFGTAVFTDNSANTKYINAIDNFIPGATSSFLRRDGTFDIPTATVDFSTLTAITTVTSSDTFVVASKTSVITYSNLLSRIQADISASGTFDFGTLTAITTITGTDTFVIANRTSTITYTNLLSRLQSDISASGTSGGTFDFGTLTAITTITGSDTFAIASRTGAITYTNLLSRLQSDISASGTGGFANDFPIATVTGNTTANTAHFTILVQCNSADITITLPAAASSSKLMYNIKKIDETSGNVIIDPDGSELIDGDTSHTITNPYGSRTIHCNGSAWYIV